MFDTRNPFTYGTTVAGEDFVGRGEEIANLVKTIRLGESAVVRSPDGLGKSSLLAELARRNSKEFIFVPIDLTATTDEAALLDMIARETMRAAYGNMEAFPPEAWDLLSNPALRRSVIEGTRFDTAKRYGVRAAALSAQNTTKPNNGTKPLERKMDVRMCLWCGAPLKWVEKYSRHYCYNCKKYAPVRRTVRLPRSKSGAPPTEDVKCPKCRNDLKFVHKYSEYYCDKCRRYPIMDPGRRAHIRPTQAEVVDCMDLPERVANQRATRVVVMFDEFQEIATVDNPMILETMRHRCEMHGNVSYIFAGNNNLVFRNMFQEKGGLFNNFAHWLELGPIPESQLEKFLMDKFASGKGKLKKDAADLIVGVSGGYPYYVQKIAHELFHISPSPTMTQAEEAVGAVINHQSPLCSTIWESIRSPLHRKYLLAVANEPRVAHGEDFVRRHGLRSRSHVQRTEKQLEMRGIIDDGEIIDPMFVLWLRSTA